MRRFKAAPHTCKKKGDVYCPHSGGCTNLQWDGDNCGACNHSCPYPGYCHKGKCRKNTAVSKFRDNPPSKFPARLATPLPKRFRDICPALY